MLFFRVHPSLLNLTHTTPLVSEFVPLLHNPNPYIAATAGQVLTESSQFTAADMSIIMGRSDATLIGAVVTDAQIAGWSQQGANGAWLNQRVASSTSLPALEGIAIGVYEASQILSDMTAYDVPPSVAQEKTKNYAGYVANMEKEGAYETSLMAAIRRRLNALDPGGSIADPRWQAIDAACRSYGE